jgi:hypothetical protein
MCNSLTLILSDMISCGASKLNTETGFPARPTIIVEKLSVKLDAQQLMMSIPVTRFGIVRGELSVGSGPWGNVELLTLTLSFPCHRKRYEPIISFPFAIEGAEPSGTHSKAG